MTQHEINMRVEKCHGKVFDSYGYAFYELGRAFDKLKACIWYSIWFPIWCRIIDNAWGHDWNSWQMNLLGWWSGKGRKEWF